MGSRPYYPDSRRWKAVQNVLRFRIDLARRTATRLSPGAICLSTPGTPDGAEAAGRNGFHLVANALTSQIRTMTDRYRAAFKAAHTPMLGLARFVIMGRPTPRHSPSRAARTRSGTGTSMISFICTARAR
jgi:hypothetical protein